MTCWRNLINFMKKERYDFDRPDITLYNFHPQLRVCFMLNGIFFDEKKDSAYRFTLPILNSFFALSCFGIECMLIWRGVVTEDYSFVSECLCYAVLLGTVPTVYVGILYNKNKILAQLETMNELFDHVQNLGPRYRDHFIKGQLLIWQGCWIWIFIVWVAGFVYVLNAVVILTYQSLFATLDEHAIRPLIFPLWLPYDDPYRTPNYEMFMFLEVWMIIVINQTFGTYVYMQFHILLHYYNLMDLIIMDLDAVFDGLDESVVKLPKHDPRRMEVQGILNNRIKRVVDWHMAVFRAIDMVSSVYGPPLAYQVMFSSIIICIVTYQVVDSLESGEIHIFFCLLWFEAVIQMWIPCYLGTLIRDKDLSIADACWRCGWHNTNLSRLICVDLVIIILRSQKILTIRFTGLPNLTLETFSSILSTAYSYYNMLRQTTKN